MKNKLCTVSLQSQCQCVATFMESSPNLCYNVRFQRTQIILTHSLSSFNSVTIVFQMLGGLEIKGPQTNFEAAECVAPDPLSHL